MKNRIVALCSVALLVFALGAVAQAQAPAKVAGTWVMSNMGRNGVVTNTVTITQNGANITGTMKPEMGDAIPLEDGMVNGNAVTFTVTRMGRNGAMKFQYMGTVDGDNMKGTFQAGPNAVDWTAKRS